MKIVTQKEVILRPLLQIGGVVERRQTLPILANVLINATKDKLIFTATDLEVEMKTTAAVESDGESDFTLPARKLIDICRALSDNANIEIDIQSERVILKSGRSRFSLATLPAQDYPAIEPSLSNHQFTLTQTELKRLIDKVSFAMAQQDVRYYLNGMLLEASGGHLRTVSTDGHRLALSEYINNLDSELEFKIILPRKAVLELSRLLESTDEPVKVDLSSNHVKVTLGETSFVSKLIDGTFPDYQRVIPTNMDKTIDINREELKQALLRTSILSNEKYRGIRFQFSENSLKLLAHNPEQEEAEEEMEISYSSEDLAIGFNVGYLLEVLNVIDSPEIQIALSDANSSCLITDKADQNSRYVIMPMRL